jgi:hypothetical protein
LGLDKAGVVSSRASAGRLGGSARHTDRGRIDAFQKQIQLARTDLHVLRVGRNGERNAVRTSVEACVEKAVAAPIMPEEFQVRTATIMENIYGIGPRILAELLPDEPRETIKPKLSPIPIG